MERASQEAEQELGLIHTVQFGRSRDSPLLFLIHGRAGNVDVMRAFRRVVPEGWMIISVQAPLEDPHDGGWSWWDIHDSTEVKRDAIQRASRLLSRFIEQSVEFYALSPTILSAVGFSQGAALLSLVVQEVPDLLDGVALLAGFVLKKEGVALSLPILIAHGTKDQTVSIEAAREGERYLRSCGAKVTFVEDQVGHKIGTHGMNGLKQFLMDLEAQW